MGSDVYSEDYEDYDNCDSDYDPDFDSDPESEENVINQN